MFPRGFDTHLLLTECLCLKMVEVGRGREL